MGGMASFLFHPFMEKGLGSMTARSQVERSSCEGSVSDDNPVWVEFARGMAPMTSAIFRGGGAADGRLGPAERLDIAAGHGMYGHTIARRNPAAKIHALDWKNVLAVAHENAVKFGTADRCHAIEGSAFTPDSCSGYDACWSPTSSAISTSRRTLLLRRFARVHPGAKMAIVEMAVNDDRIPCGAVSSLYHAPPSRTGEAFRCARSTSWRSASTRSHHAVTKHPQTVKIALRRSKRDRSKLRHGRDRGRHRGDLIDGEVRVRARGWCVDRVAAGDGAIGKADRICRPR